jgi:hypothetical protein
MRSIGFTHLSSLAIVLSFVFLTPSYASTQQGAPVTCSNNLHASIKNFCQVTPDVLWRGAKPDKKGAAWLIENGVRTIVNLELLHDDQDTLRQAKLAKTDKYEVDYFRVGDSEVLAVLSWDLLDDHVAHFLAIVDQAPKPIYVHCRSGQNRTGVMVAAYRVIVEGEGEDKAIDKAIAEMEGYQGLWFKADAAYIRGLSPERRADIRRKVKDWIQKLKRDARIVCEKGKCRVSDH